MVHLHRSEARNLTSLLTFISHNPRWKTIQPMIDVRTCGLVVQRMTWWTVRNQVYSMKVTHKFTTELRTITSSKYASKNFLLALRNDTACDDAPLLVSEYITWKNNSPCRSYTVVHIRSDDVG